MEKKRDPFGSIIDSTFLYNVLATEYSESILKCLPQPVVISEYTIKVEFSKHPYKNSIEDELTEFNLKDLSRILTIVKPESQDEIATFVYLTQIMDEGGAQSLSIALYRNYFLVSDDKSVNRVNEDAKLNIPLMSTPEILKLWSAGRSDKMVRQAIYDIESKAHFFPLRNTSDYVWWDKIRSVTSAT
jgi:hypothetical protein